MNWSRSISVKMRKMTNIASDEEEFKSPPAGSNSGRRGGKSVAAGAKTTGQSDDEDEDGLEGGGGYGTDEEVDDALKQLEEYKQKLSISNKKLQKVGQALVKTKAQLKDTEL